MSIWLIKGEERDEWDQHDWVVGYAQTKDEADAVIDVLRREVRLARTILGPLKRAERIAWKKCQDHEEYVQKHLAMDLHQDHEFWRKFHESAAAKKLQLEWHKAHGVFWQSASDMSNKISGKHRTYMFVHMRPVTFYAVEVVELGTNSSFVSNYAPSA